MECNITCQARQPESSDRTPVPRHLPDAHPQTCCYICFHQYRIWHHVLARSRSHGTRRSLSSSPSAAGGRRRLPRHADPHQRVLHIVAGDFVRRPRHIEYFRERRHVGLERIGHTRPRPGQAGTNLTVGAHQVPPAALARVPPQPAVVSEHRSQRPA
eukprot:scaffold2699_cov98-Isochrysis_galbana.AAC.9